MNTVILRNVKTNRLKHKQDASSETEAFEEEKIDLQLSALKSSFNELLTKKAKQCALLIYGSKTSTHVQTVK